MQFIYSSTKAFIFNILVALILSAFAFNASATDKELIATIDWQIIDEKSLAIQKIKEQLEKKMEEFNKEYKQKEEYFKKKYAELEKQKSVLAKEAFEKQSDNLSKEFSDTQKKHLDNQKIVEKAYAEAGQHFRKTFEDVVKEEATKLGVKIVLNKIQLIYSDPTLDITAKVLEALNKKLPSITVKF